MQDKLAYRYRTTEEKKEIVVAVWDLDLMRRLMDYVLEDEKLLANIEKFMATEQLNEDARPNTHRKKLVR